VRSRCGGVSGRFGEYYGCAEPEHVTALDVTGGVLPVLGVSPMLGGGSTARTYAEESGYGADDLWILATEVWRRPLGRWAHDHGGWEASADYRSDAEAVSVSELGDSGSDSADSV
jgi:hypothetical protein